MSTLREMFAKMKIPLYQNESLDLDHYYQEPFQDIEEENPDQYEMATPFESITTKKETNLYTCGNIELLLFYGWVKAHL